VPLAVTHDGYGVMCVVARESSAIFHCSSIAGNVTVMEAGGAYTIEGTRSGLTS